MRTLILTWFSLCAATAACGEASAQPSIVKIVQNGDNFELQRNGAAYFIRGVCGHQQLDTLAAFGGNSVRSYGADQAAALLPEAQKNGLSVTLGYWMGHPRHGFNYLDPKAVAAQQEKLCDFVRANKDHPALLIWALGNEVELGVNDKSPEWEALWRALDAAARAVKQLDPNHPVMLVVAEIWQTKIDALNKYCEAIDVLGINSYGGLGSVHERVVKFGWKKPYIVTEFGPNGPTEGALTAWRAPVELNSTEKALVYLQRYQQAIDAHRGECLGSYAFLWGHKQEATATWYGMLLPSGESLGAADALKFAWTGAWPQRRAPAIKSLRLIDGSNQIEPGEQRKAEVTLEPADGAPIDGATLSYRWVLAEEGGARKQGGDKEAAPRELPEFLEHGDTAKVEIKAPPSGEYRLFIYISDGKGRAATGNLPFVVKGQR